MIKKLIVAHTNMNKNNCLGHSLVFSKGNNVETGWELDIVIWIYLLIVNNNNQWEFQYA
jgi:hypothetical protein